MRPLIDLPAVYLRPLGAVRVSGPDRLGYLHNMLSQSLADASAGDVADFLHLDPKGVVLAMGRAVVHAEAVLLATTPDAAPALAETLDRMRFLTDVTVQDVSSELALASVRGPDVAVPGARTEPMTAAPHGDGLVIRDRSGGVDLLGARDWVLDRVEGLDLPEATEDDWETWRISNGLPEWRKDVTPGRRPQELGLLPTHVHLRKGCYPGQESIAKTWNLGRPRRALALVELDRRAEVGAEVQAGDGRGELTSVAPTGDPVAALALLPIDRDSGDVLGDGTLTGSDFTGRVRKLVGADLPQPGAEEGGARPAGLLRRR